MSIPFRLYEGEVKSNVVVLGPNSLLQADSFHPHWQQILEGVRAGDESVFELFDVRTGLARRFQNLSERVSYNGTDILFDGDVIHSVLANQVLRALESSEADYKPLVNFWEKLESNPNEHSKKQAYDWLATHDFKITESGDVVGYKGVRQVSENVFESTWASTLWDVPSGFVNGQPVPALSRIRQSVGDVVTMPRTEVKHDPNVACSRGLHIGDWSFASTYGNAVLEVHFNPRDIVSIPRDEQARKARVSRYKVMNVVTAEYKGGPILRPENVKDWSGDVGYAPQQ